MAIERSGVELILKNFNGFISGMQRINKEYERQGKAAASMANQVANATTRAANAQNRVDVATRNAAKASLILENAQKLLTIAYLRLSAAQNRAKPSAEAIASAQEAIKIAANNVTIAIQNQANAQTNLATANNNLSSAQNKQAQTMAASASGAVSLAASFGSVATVVSGLGVALPIIGSILSWVGGVIGKVTGALKDMVVGGINLAINAFKKLGEIVGNAFNSVKEFVTHALSTAAGILFADTIRKIAESIGDLTSEMGQVLGDFQKFEIQFQALTARDKARELGIGIAEAFKYAELNAKSLLSWVKQLAVTTPFTARSLTETLAMANAMGLSIGMAKDLTVATGNFTAAMGLTEDHMFRIIYNFGQMLAQGKLNGREFRDLANSFIPVNLLLERMAKKVNMATADFKKLAFEGKVPVMAFFDEFIKMANNDFPNAMEKMARTLTGVMNNLKDFFELIIGVEALGPVFNKMTSMAADALNKLLSPQVRDAATFFGQKLLFAFNNLLYPINKLGQAVQNLLASFGLVGFDLGTFIMQVSAVFRRVIQSVTAWINVIATKVPAVMKQLAANAYTWGQNITAMFAKGLVSVINLIAMAINAIARMITSLLSTHSPPKVLPKITEWGRNTAGEWLKGFSTGIPSGAINDAIQGGVVGGGVHGLPNWQKTTTGGGTTTAKKSATGGGGGAGATPKPKFPKWNIAGMSELLSRFAEADFEALKGIQGPLSSILDLFTQTGKITEKKAGELFRDISVGIAEVINGTGNAEALFNKIRKTGGQFGNELAKLAKLHIDLAGATKIAEQAELALQAAQKRESDIRVGLNKKIREYNRMIRAGAGKAVLKAKLAEINAQEDAARLATEQRKQAETQLEVAKANLEALQKQVKVMEELIAQLTDITSRQIIDVGALAGAAGSGVADAIADAFSDIFGGQGTDTLTRLLPDFETMANNLMIEIQGQVDAGLANIGTAWSSFWNNPELKTAVDALTGSVGALMSVLGVGTVEDPRRPKGEWPLITNLRKFGEAIGTINDRYMGSMITNMGIFKTKMEEMGAPTITFGVILGIVERILLGLYNTFLLASSVIAAWITAFAVGAATVKNIIQTAKDFINQRMAEVYLFYKEKWTNIRDIIFEILGNAPNMGIGWAITKFIVDHLDNLIATFQKVVEKVSSLVTWIGNLASALAKLDIAKLWKLITGGPDPAPAHAAGGPVRKNRASIVGEKGWEMFVPSVSGMIYNQSQLASMFSSMFSRQSDMMPYSGSMAGGRTVIVNMGGVSIYNGMDAAELKATIRGVIRQEFT